MAFPFDVFSWLIRGRYKASPTAVSDGGTPEFLTDALGRLRIVIDSMAAATAYSFYRTAAGPAKEGVIKASAGSLRQVIVSNKDTVDIWIGIFNAAEVGTGVLFAEFKVPAEDSVTLALEGDVAFSTGIVWVARTDFDLENEPVDPVIFLSALYL